jgi:hypothetical protein
MRGWVLSFLISAVLPTAAAVAAVTSNLAPVAIAQAQDAGAGYVLRTPLLSTGVWIGPSKFGMERAIVEYDLSTVPSDAMINSATLSVVWAAWSNSTVGGTTYFPTVHISAYAGDDTATASDATKTGNEIASYSFSLHTPSTVTITLPTSFIQSELSASPPSLGLLFTVTSLDADEIAAINNSSPYPTLNLTTIPEPSLIPLLAALCLFSRRRGRELKRWRAL